VILAITIWRRSITGGSEIASITCVVKAAVGAGVFSGKVVSA